MRDAIGSTWVFSIVITFTMIFAGFLVLVLSYSRAYKIKNELTSMFEKYEGATDKSIKIMNDYLKNNGYTAQRNCSTGWYGVKDLDSVAVEKVTDSSEKYYYCFKNTSETRVSDTSVSNSGNCHIEIQVFYYFNLPVLGHISNNTVTGQTNSMKYVYIMGNYADDGSGKYKNLCSSST